MSRKSKKSFTVIALVLVGAALGALLPSILEAVNGEEPAQLTQLGMFAKKNAAEHYLVIDKLGRDAHFQFVTGKELAELDAAAGTVRFVVAWRATLLCKGTNCLPCRTAECPIPPWPFRIQQGAIAWDYRMGEEPKELMDIR